MDREIARDASFVGALTCDAEAVRGDADAVVAVFDQALGGRYSLEPGPRRVRSITYLDSADWRLHRKGVVLAHERGSGAGTLTVRSGKGVATAALAEQPSWPAMAHELPDEVRTLVDSPLWIRAVQPVVHGRVVTRYVRVHDTGGTAVAVLAWRETAVSEPVRIEPFVRVDVALAGEEGSVKAAKRVRKVLRRHDSGRFRTTSADPYPDVLAAAGLPDRPEPPAITPDLPAGVAVARALRAQAAALEATVDGTIADTDTEYLHDLRVAVRRTRSLLKLADDVLPTRLTTRYAREFAWLGEVTSPVRDLDVYLLGFEDLTRRLVAADPADLEPFAADLRRRRETARRALVRSLRTKRFARLMQDWTAELAELSRVPGDDTPGTGAPDGDVSDGDVSGGRAGADDAAADGPADPGPDVAAFVRRRLVATAKKVTKRAAAITPESPADDVHDLRKRCKELRYLLEFAEPLCPRAEHAAAVKRLRRLQDILGAFQDGEVQSLDLKEQAARLSESGRAPVETLLAMGELAGTFAVDQQRARHELTAALCRFLGEDMRKRIGALVA